MELSSTATVYAAIRTMAPPTVAAALNGNLTSATSISVSFIQSKKGRQVFQEKNRGVTPSVAAPGVTHPSDATETAFELS